MGIEQQAQALELSLARLVSARTPVHMLALSVTTSAIVIHAWLAELVVAP